MNVLNVYDPQNTWVGTYLKKTNGWFKKDGDEFERQAKNCFKYYCKDSSVTEIRIMGKGAQEKRAHLFKALSAIDIKFDRINFFMHGHPRALNRGMIKQGVNLWDFCKKLKAIAADDCKIVFNSCKTGKFDDGFAATVAQMTGLETMGNTKSGHTTKLWARRLFNPMYLSFGIAVKRTNLWSLFGGARALKKRLWSSKTAPFEFVEEVFSGE